MKKPVPKATQNKTVQVGDQFVKLIDNTQPLYAELITELWNGPGVVGLTLAAVTVDNGEGGDQFEVVVQSRLRMPMVTAQELHEKLGELLRHAAKKKPN